MNKKTQNNQKNQKHTIYLQIEIDKDGWNICGTDSDGIHNDNTNWYSYGNCHDDVLSDVECSLRYELMEKGVLLEPKNHDDPPEFIYDK